jgi:NAD(P)-dependent dehydrogenase (short-subunit alcohol dehydrogenase family)
VVRTEMGAHWLNNPQTREQVLARIPLGRVADPKDVAGAAVFFASPAAAFVSGQVLYLDGGLTACQ